MVDKAIHFENAPRETLAIFDNPVFQRLPGLIQYVAVRGRITVFSFLTSIISLIVNPQHDASERALAEVYPVRADKESGCSVQEAAGFFPEWEQEHL